MTITKKDLGKDNYYYYKPMVIAMDILYPDKYHEFFKYQIRTNNYVLGIFKSKSRAIKFMGKVIRKNGGKRKW